MFYGDGCVPTPARPGALRYADHPSHAARVIRVRRRSNLTQNVCLKCFLNDFLSVEAIYRYYCCLSLHLGTIVSCHLQAIQDIGFPIQTKRQNMLGRRCWVPLVILQARVDSAERFVCFLSASSQIRANLSTKLGGLSVLIDFTSRNAHCKWRNFSTNRCG